MLLTIFLILLSLSLFFIILGFSIDESTFQIVGFVFLFFLSATVITTGSLQGYAGETTTFVYNNETLIASTQTPITISYDEPGVVRLGVWLSIISGLGVALSIVNIRSWIKSRKGDDD